MQKVLCFSVIVVCTALALAGCRHEESSNEAEQQQVHHNPADLKAVVEGNNQFAFDLYAKLADQGENLVFSPYSISTALAMTYAGARGETAKGRAGCQEQFFQTITVPDTQP